MTTVQGPSPEKLQVLETGSGISPKVHTDGPHLVSLGSGRLNAALTLHPINDGRTRVGNDDDADVRLTGTGIEPLHCVIETTANGSVTLYPVAGTTTLDGIPVVAPYRLHQGNVLCLGLATHLRFNHATETNMMKTPNGDGRPPLAPLHRSWGESQNGPEDSYELSAQNHSRSIISPKVFPIGCATLNSPASVVLGHCRAPNGVSSTQDVENRSPGPQNGVFGYIEPPVVQSIASFPQKASVSYTTDPQQNGYGNPLFSSYPSPLLSEQRRSKEGLRNLQMPSPAFNRNPSPFFSERARSVTPSLSSLSPRRSPSVSYYSPEQSQENLNARTEELLKAQINRKREEVIQILEKQRLDEILSVCAEYERQAQTCQSQKPPTTPTMQQNRIITNGSLPREVRSGGLSPSAGSTSEDDVYLIGHVPGSPRSVRARPAPQPLRTVTPDTSHYRSVYENLTRPNVLDVTVHKHMYVENTLVIDTTEADKPPQSPRTRIKTTFKDQNNSLAVDDAINDYDVVDPVQRRHFSPNLQKRQFLTPSQQLTKFNQIMQDPETPEDKFILPLGDASDLSDILMKFDKELSNCSFVNGEPKRSAESRVSQEVANDLPESERDLHIHLPNLSISSNNSYFASPKSDKKLFKKKRSDERSRERKGRGTDLTSILRPKKVNPEEAALHAEREQLAQSIGSLKTEAQAIQQQEEEILRDMEFERALIEAEYLMQRDKRKLDEEKLELLRSRQKVLDIEIGKNQQHDSDAQTRCLDRIREFEEQVASMSSRLGERREYSAEYIRVTELLDQEKKAFEDLEFKHLEEEANWLATREDFQRDMDEVVNRLEGRTTRLQELQRQVDEMQRLSANESRVLELQKLQILQRIEAARLRLKQLDIRLSHHSDHSRSSDNEDELNFSHSRPKSKQFEEDLDRINRITHDAPIIDPGNNATLTRKTIDDLERNRLLHLAKRGAHVIEEERRRMEDVRKRVQDRTRAEWEQNRQRQPNEMPEYSIGSEDSSLASADFPSDSISSGDMDRALNAAVGSIGNGITHLPPIADANPALMDSMIRETDDEGSLQNSRPISNYSSSEVDQSAVKKRDSNPDRLLQQRPLTRYLPIRGDTLNLRQHIETAGHPVELCRHVQVDATSCRGLLHKMAGKFHHWNKRWFVFDRTKKSLTYYSDRSERKPRGGTYFQAIEEVYVDHLNSVKSPHPHLTFVIKTKERTFYLMAPSAEAMRIWVDVVFTGAEGYQEFERT